MTKYGKERLGFGRAECGQHHLALPLMYITYSDKGESLSKPTSAADAEHVKRTVCPCQACIANETRQDAPFGLFGEVVSGRLIYVLEGFGI